MTEEPVPAQEPVETKKVVVVSDTCPHCQEIKDYIKEKGLDVQMINVSTPEGLQFAKDHNIMAVPECVIVEGKDGQQVKVCTKEEFEKLLEDGK